MADLGCPSRSAPGAEELHRVRGAARGGRWHLPPLGRLLQHPAAAVSRAGQEGWRPDGDAADGMEMETGAGWMEMEQLGWRREQVGWRSEAERAGMELKTRQDQTGGRQVEDGDGMEMGADRMEVETGRSQGWDRKGGRWGGDGDGTSKGGNGDGMIQDQMGWRQGWGGHETRWDGGGTETGVDETGPDRRALG